MCWGRMVVECEKVSELSGKDNGNRIRVRCEVKGGVCCMSASQLFLLLPKFKVVLMYSINNSFS